MKLATFPAEHSLILAIILAHSDIAMAACWSHSVSLCSRLIVVVVIIIIISSKTATVVAIVVVVAVVVVVIVVVITGGGSLEGVSDSGAMHTYLVIRPSA